MADEKVILPEFREWAKIPRLRRNITITEKIDGTNAQVYIDENGNVWAGSRTRWVFPGADNYSFGAWVDKNKDALKALLGPGRHYGEWWGAGIQRTYGLKDKRFSLFNVQRYEEQMDKGALATLGVYAVPVLYRGPFTDAAIENALIDLQTTGSKAALGFMKPEGVVVFHEASRMLFKRTIENDDSPKSAV